jgi:uncharacterized surface protein with fasciclin (FAS1) repeats
MKNKYAILVALSITMATVSIAYAAETAFNDVEADFWGKDAINWAAEAGLMGKNGDGSYSENFRPNESMTRAELATVLQRYYMMTNVELSNENPTGETTTPTVPKTVVDVAAQTGSISIMSTLFNTASLVELLKDDGPFTVFAPNNAAFDKVGAAALTDLLKSENKQKLVRMLSYHVVPGKITLDKLSNGQKLKTLQGQELTVRITGEGTSKVVMIDDAKLVAPNIAASNGVIHELDRVVSATNSGLYDSSSTETEDEDSTTKASE